MHEKMKAMVYLKRCGLRYEPFRKEAGNDYARGIDTYVNTVSQQYRQLELWRPVYLPPRTEIRNGDSHLQKVDSSSSREKEEQDSQQYDGDSMPKFKCFKCDREGCRANECKHEIKEDGRAINTNQ